ncbi:MAG: hypothetical protein ABL953_12105 [Ilumatobacteraceae bacterium]
MPNNGSVRSPRQGYAPAPLEIKSNNTGLYLIIGLVVLALIGVVTLLFSMSGTDKDTLPTLAPFGATTLPADATTTIPRSSAIIPITDDTGTFSVNLRGDLQMETAPSIAAGGFTVPRITASVDLPAYYADNTTFGVLIVAVGPDIGSEVAQVLSFMEPNESVCLERVRETITTSVGNAVRISLTGCGIDSLGTKVLLSVPIAEPPLVIGIRMQDTGELATIQAAALYLLETMQF